MTSKLRSPDIVCKMNESVFDKLINDVVAASDESLFVIHEQSHGIVFTHETRQSY